MKPDNFFLALNTPAANAASVLALRRKAIKHPAQIKLNPGEILLVWVDTGFLAIEPESPVPYMIWRDSEVPFYGFLALPAESLLPKQPRLQAFVRTEAAA